MWPRALGILTVLGVLCLFASAPTAQVHKDERIGYQIKLPKKWTQIPLQFDEQWIVANFVAPSPDYYTDSDSGYTRQHKSTLRVIAFVDEFINSGVVVDKDEDKKDGDEDDDDDDGDDEGSSGIRFFNIYRDYKEFLKSTYGQGYFIESESAEEEGGRSVEKLEIRVEDSSGSGHKLIHTWIYATDIGKVAVEFEVLEDADKKLKSTVSKTFRSFEVIPRTKALTLSNGASEFISYFELRRLTVSERNEKKQAMLEQRWERMKAEVIEGWEAYELDGVKILTRHDEKHAQAVVDNILAVMEWLDDTFPFIGPEEHVRLPIVRICEDREEESRFTFDSTALGFSMLEIVTHKDLGGATGFEWQWINIRAKDLWLYERNPDLTTALPLWLRVGLDQVLRGAKLKGSKLKFDRNSWEMGFNDGQEPWSLERVMKLGLDDFEERDFRTLIQIAGLTRFFISGPGSKGKTKDVLANYVANVIDIVAEIDAEDEAKDESSKSKRPKSEEEEDAMLKERQAKLRERERRILDEAYARTAASLSESQLDSLAKSYRKEMD